MDLQALIAESAQLLVIGMGTVFVILIMLIFMINTVSKLLPEEVIEPIRPATTRPAPAAKTAAPDNNNELVAVISAAIKTYKNRHNS